MMHLYYTHHYIRGNGSSHRLLAEAIAAYLDIAVGQAEILVSTMQRAPLAGNTDIPGDNGKPYIPGFAPFSISHSSKTWAVLILDSNADGDECGLDIQYTRRADTGGIAKRFYAPEDSGRIASLSDGKGRDREFFRLWTRREALVKAIGTSAADTQIPSVLGDEVFYKGRHYIINDIQLPDGSELSAAICVRTSNFSHDRQAVRMHSLEGNQ